MAGKDFKVVPSDERTNAAGKPVSNKILCSISDSDYEALRPHLEYVSLPNHLVLHAAGAKIRYPYFPTSAPGIERSTAIFRRITRKLGKPQAITATAHKLARIVYHLLRTKEAYNETVFHRCDEEALRRAQFRLRRQAA